MPPPAPEQLTTERLMLRRPRTEDADAIYQRYASDPEVTRYLAWLRHTSLDDTRAFLHFSDAEWRLWGCGPYLAWSQDDEVLLGSTGLAFVTRAVASTGYVFAKDAWGYGYATEVLRAMTSLARSLGVRRLEAVCHVDHRASERVMIKGGFVREGILRRHMTFPNISPARSDVLSYKVEFDPAPLRPA